MKKIVNLSILVFVTLFFAACAGTTPQQSTLIDKQKVLKQSPFDDSVYYYLDKSVDFKQYGKVVVPKIPVKENAEGKVIDKKVKEEISEYFTEKLSLAVNEVASKNKGANTLKLDIAIEKVDVAYEDLKFYNFIPVALAVKAISRGTGIEDKDLIVAVAMRLTDVNNQKVVALAVDSKKIKNVNEIKDITLEKVKPLLDEWIARLKLRIQDFSKGVYKDL